MPALFTRINSTRRKGRRRHTHSRVDSSHVYSPQTHMDGEWDDYFGNLVNKVKRGGRQI